mgnify:CR=1 FL=1
MIRKQWFEDTTNPKKGKKSKKKFGEGRLESYESTSMELCLCLLADTNNDTTIVSKLFDFSRKSCTTKKKLLQDKFVSTASEYYYDESSTTKSRVHSSRTPSRDVFSPSLQERYAKKKRTTATPKELLQKLLSSATKTTNKKRNENQTSTRNTSPTNVIAVGETLSLIHI